ncbi:MAG: hypothetical protein OQK82_01225, partial [Candidatus Pacearchaeota archaeon]|nr:hypothetical protein [Candidatus Pacearchaeota archaeon]
MTTAREIYGTNWSEKEYIIVLHYYFLHRGTPQHADTPFVQELASALGRTPHSILYRLQNFSSIDPESTKKGLSHLTEFGKRIFHEWSIKKESLKDTAEVSLRDIKSDNQPDLFHPNPIRMPVTFNNYELLDKVGDGGFGSVFSCLNIDTADLRAIKIINGENVAS